VSLRLFQHGRLAMAGHAEPQPVDILAEDGVVKAIGPGLPVPPGAERIDCSGLILLPGLYDAHVHLREPGREDCETIVSGTEAAIAGGFTGLLAMPNTDPPIDTGGMVTFVGNMARTRARIPVAVAGCLTKGRTGEKLAEIADMAEQGAVMVTDCNHALQNAYVLRRALEYTRHFNVIVGVYPDTPALSADGVMHEGRESFRLGLPGIPAMAEEIGIERDLRVAHATRGRIHIQNVSTAEGVASIRRFKERGTQVTAEVTPHHLLLNHSHVTHYNTHFKMMPPLRTEEDQAALLAGLIDGTLDILATGHAPHTAYEKNLDFRNAPFGVLGLETALTSLFTHLIQPGKLGWGVLVERFCHAPRRLLQLPADPLAVGQRLELVAFDPAGETSIRRDTLRSLSWNTPWLGKTLHGAVRRVDFGGKCLLGAP
jgi:dihydroorotase